MTLLGLLLFWVTVMVCCDDDPPTGTIGTAIVHFPNKVGSEWTYEFYDSLHSFVDTVDVSVAGIKTLQNGEDAKIWIWSFRNAGTKVDTHYVVEAGDTVRIYWSIPPGPISFLFPLETGRSWTSGGQSIDTSAVTDSALVCLSAGNLRWGYQIKRQWTGLEENEQSEIWFVPGVGVFSMHLSAFSPHSGANPPAINESWILLSYELPD